MIAQRMLVLVLAAICPLVSAEEQAAPAFDVATTLVDEFDDHFELDWEVLREDETAWSLESHPGELALTTLAGSMYARNELAYQIRPQNILLLKESIGPDQDFEATLFVNLYEPEVQYQQIALLMYQDDENYAKWEISLRDTGTDHTRLASGIERDNQVKQIKSLAYAVDGPLWLRMTRVDGKYYLSVSDDGDQFVVKNVCAPNPSDTLPAPRVGFVAKNGNAETARNVILLESFELKLGAAE